MASQLNRRQALVTALLGIWALSSCSWLMRRPLRPICPLSPEVSLPGGPLIIDAHCHVFNGTDLQVATFLSKVAVRQDSAMGAGAIALGDILQHIVWTLAPDGDQELKALANIDAALQSCVTGNADSRVADMRQDAYTVGRAQLQVSVERSMLFRSLQQKSRSGINLFSLDSTERTQIEAIRHIEALPEDVEAYRSAKAAKNMSTMSVGGRSASGLIDFVLQNFQYRYVSVHDYLRTYNQPGKRIVDLMLTSMVDYDWWLAKGYATHTPLKTQVKVMKQIAILTGGRVHSFVPFDPLRQVAFELKISGEDSLSLVREAIEMHGCIGVKLYPPMGFAALGNASLHGPHGTSFWARSWLPEWTDRTDLGQLLDTAMSKMLSWCEANQVPVMAHSSLSNGVTDDFEALAGAQYWAMALTAFPRLHVSFGHFGGTARGTSSLEAAEAFARLMVATPRAAGEFAFADAGYFVEVMTSEPRLRDTLQKLYENTAPKGNAALANRFMYGTDWEMTLTEGEIDTYLSQFVQLFQELEAGPAIQLARIRDLSAKFFGANAVDWLGLHKSGAARDRLETFYSENRMAAPEWMAKVDRSPA